MMLIPFFLFDRDPSAIKTKIGSSSSVQEVHFIKSDIGQLDQEKDEGLF